MKNALLITVVMLISLCGKAQTKHQLTIETGETLAEVAPTMWGIFFEDINFAADGGIYAELVKNRSFEFRHPMMGWHAINLDMGKGEVVAVNHSGDASNNSRFLRIKRYNTNEAFGLRNEGFRGMGIREGESYNFYIMARKLDKDLKMTIQLIDAEGQVLGESRLDGFDEGWKEYQASIKATKTEANAQLKVLFEGEGSIDIDMVSLFPQNTWKNRPKGLRSDLIEMLEALKPGFVRFPGGCIVEGYTLENRYQWKNTVGPIEERVLIKNRWLDEFRHRYTPDYFQSYGIGFYEYFLLAEDLGAEPLPILNSGMACQYNSGEVAAMEDLEPYIQDALDLIEFANGDLSSKWGKLRADMGHPEPFNLTYLGIGNEQWGPQYIERYREFHKVLKEKHPEIQIISAAGPTTDERNTFLWKELTALNADIIDEHYYKPPNWFLENANRYDSFDRNGPKVFAGEYASHVRTENKAPEARNNWWAALTEAAFMTGLERNADIVVMTAYAPLLANKNAWQWNPDMIWFDNLNAMPTPNYFVQQIFSLNKGNRILPVKEEGNELIGQDSLYASVSIDDEQKLLLLKLVNVSSEIKEVEINTADAKIKPRSELLIESLSAPLSAYNEVGGSNNFEKQTTTMAYKSVLPQISLKPHSVSVVKIQLK